MVNYENSNESFSENLHKIFTPAKSRETFTSLYLRVLMSWAVLYRCIVSARSYKCSEERPDVSTRMSGPLLGRLVEALRETARQHARPSLSTRRADRQLDINWPLCHQPHMHVSTTDTCLSLHTFQRELYVPPTGVTSHFSRRSCSTSAPSTWNYLPQHIRSIDRLSTFKRQLKSQLFFQSAFTV